MTTEPRSPNPKRRPAGWGWRGPLLLAVGAVAYYAFGLIDRAITDRLIADSPGDGIIQVAEIPSDPAPTGPSQGPGNALLQRAATAIDQRPAITATITQTGWLAGRRIETRGDYAQIDSGAKRKFLLRQQGEVAGATTRLLRVSNNRFLWTDLAWAGDASEPQRSVTRIDLRKVKIALAESGPLDQLATDPGSWSRYGGLPTLLSGLEENFTFGQPYRMQLGDQLVLAMVGRWRPERLAELVSAGPSKRTPHHVVVALVERNLSPVFLEYRSRDDALSTEGLPDVQLLRQPSTRPLLKIDLAINLTPTQQLDPRLFAYQASSEVFIDDQTDRELRLVKASRTARVASR